MVLAGSPDEIKAMNAQLIQLLAPTIPPPSEAVISEDGEVDGIKYRVYRPRNATQPLPVGIWTHGGGWMVGDLNSDDALCRVICEHANSVIVNVDYRLTPEFKMPTQLQDTLTVYRWAHGNASSIGGDSTKFYTIGGSAGGALALEVANRLVKDPSKRDNIKGVAAIVPVALHWSNVPDEYKSMYKAYEDNKSNVPIIDQESMRIFFEHSGVKADDPDVFVALDAENHKNYPPTYLVACEKDPLRDDAYVMEAALKKAGVPTKLDFYPGLPHYFWIFSSVPESKQFVANLLNGVQWLISQM
jgi:versiconal hemiacetal acetate esterase